MRTPLRLTLVALLALSPSFRGAPMKAGDAADTEARTVVVELFTSQGCSSCPPADRLLAALGEESAGRVVPLAFHVDSWNHIGWTDPFSSAEWTRRQDSYARTLGVKGIYTPQAVINGVAELLGSDERGLRAAVAAAAARPAVEIALRLESTTSRLLVHALVNLPEELRDRKLVLMLAIFESGLVTPVKRGENGGRTLRNDNVVRLLRRGARLEADDPGQTEHRFELKLGESWRRSQLGIVAFLQDPRSLEIHGARSQWLAAAR